MKSRSRITSAQVAELARVSQSAVSRTFTPGASVAPDTRDKVLAAARQLGYRPNAIARSLISGRSRMIGLLAAYFDNQFYPIVLEQLARALQVHGYHTLLFIAETGDQDKQLEKLLQYQVDGVVLASATLSNTLAHECAEASIPVVLFNRNVTGSPASSVTSDNTAGGAMVADFLVQGGHKRIAYVAGDENSSTNLDREAGFVKQLATHGVELFGREVGGYSTDGAIAATRALMSGSETPDALFVANDHMAFAVMDTLRQGMGLTVPQDVSVIGFDDVPQAAWKAYSLTTVQQPAENMIAATVELLLAQIENGNVEASVQRLPVSMIVRETARKPPAYQA